MATLQEIIDDIRSFEAAGNRIPDETQEGWAQRYAHGCRDVNDRLRRCDDAMRRGHRSDAIRLAEEEPNLLDRAALLDFPEAAAWANTCRVYDLTMAPDLLLEVTTELHEAYTAEKSLTTLMANHRVMALARAPLDEHLTVMRRIAELDPNNAFWDEDIIKFEEARLVEIRAQFAEAMKVHDRAAVARLNEEVNKPVWRIQIRQQLRRVLYDYAVRFQAQDLIAQLRGMLPELAAARDGDDCESCRVLLDEWSAIVEAVNLSVPRDLKEKVNEFTAWLQEQDTQREYAAAFEEACAFLVGALDRDQSSKSLQRAYHAAAAYQFEIPAELEQRYRKTLKQHAAALRRRRWLMYGGIVALLAGGTTAVLVHQHLAPKTSSDGPTTQERKP